MANNPCNEYDGGPQTGADSHFYINVSNNVATPLWFEIGAITDFSVDDFSLNLAELKRRGNDYTKSVAALFNAATVSFRLVAGIGDTMSLIRDNAFMARAAFHCWVTDRDITAAGAIPADVQVLELPLQFSAFPWDQPLEDITGHDVTASVAYLCSVDSIEIDPTYFAIVAPVTIQN